MNEASDALTELGPKWEGELVQITTGTLDEISRKIPHFERRPFVAAAPDQADSPKVKRQSAHRFRDLIVRATDNDDESEVPVGVVSKKYGLVQHLDVFKAVTTAMENADIAVDEVRCALSLTEYKSRMRLGFILPAEYEFDPGDGHSLALRLECFNSVDGSTRLWMVLGWLRFVCGNGLILGTTRLNLRQVHNEKINVKLLGDSLCKALASIEREHKIVKEWAAEAVTANALNAFADGPLRRKWGIRAAARFLLICETGYDGRPRDPFEKAKPSELTMRNDRSVPGAAAPARNAFDASQALAWLAHQRRDVQEQLERTRHIPALIAALLRQKN